MVHDMLSKAAGMRLAIYALVMLTIAPGTLVGVGAADDRLTGLGAFSALTVLVAGHHAFAVAAGLEGVDDTAYFGPRYGNKAVEIEHFDLVDIPVADICRGADQFDELGF